MRKMNPVVLVLVASCLLPAPVAFGQGRNAPASSKESGKPSGKGMTATEQTASGSGNIEEQIKTLEARLLEALLKRDTRFLEKYLGDDYTAIRADGKLEMRAQVIESLTSGSTRFESYDVHELKIRIYGDAAIATLLFSATATINGKPSSGDFRATRVWVRQKDNWKLVRHQATRVATASQ